MTWIHSRPRNYASLHHQDKAFIIIFETGITIQVEVEPLEQIVDITSAGDGLVSGYIAAYMRGSFAAVSAAYAAKVASIIIFFSGAIVNKASFLNMPN